MKRKLIGTEEFLGLQTDVERSMRKGQTTDQNGDRSVRGMWKVRLGLGDTGIADGADRIDAVGFGVCASGDYYMMATSAGDVLAGAMPTPAWS